MEEIEKVEIIENTVEYSQPKFWHTVMARFVDIFLFFMISAIIFSIANSIVVKTKWHRDIETTCDQIRLDSTLYYKNVDDEIEFITDYIDDNVNYPTYTGKVENFLKPVIETSFPNYLATNCGEEAKNKYLDSYSDFRKSIKNSSGVNYFVASGDSYVENPDIYVSENMKDYYSKVYTYFLEKYALGYLISSNETYYELTRELSIVFICVEVPLCLLTGFILVYFVPPLFFKRGRKTLGHALYKISLMDSRLLSPTFGRFLARTGIILCEIILSIFTFGIPLILSFSLNVFSKMHQGFADYMLKLVKIDSSKNKVYMTYDEAKILELPDHKKPVDFKMERTL